MKLISDIARNESTNIFLSVHPPVLDILTIGRIYNIGYLFLNFDIAFSFAWNLKLIALILVTFEFLQIITKKNKYISFVRKYYNFVFFFRSVVVCS